MSGFDLDISSSVFARRLGTLLACHRTRSKQYLWRLSRRSDGRFSVEDLQAIESGERQLDEELVVDLLELYGTDLDELLPSRVRLEIDPLGTISANGVELPFAPEDPVAMLAAYLDLVRRLRDQVHRTVIELRRDDVEVLADHLGDSGSNVVLQLARLMGANERERRAMAAMFIAGATVISVSTPKSATPAPQVVSLRQPPPARPAGDHPSRYHVVIPEREPQVGTVTVLADRRRHD